MTPKRAADTFLSRFTVTSLLCLVNFALLKPSRAEDEPSMCSAATIEIMQSLTLERQSFDARMRISNGLEHLPVEDLLIVLSFRDEDGEAVEWSRDADESGAVFFVRVDSILGADSIDGDGMIAPMDTAEIRWVIIPAADAGGVNPEGTSYSVGATVSYRIGDAHYAMDVASAYIRVKPMPRLHLDFFLPGDVYADDPFTSEVEPPVAFSLGLVVGNHGFGDVAHLSIDAGQPEIVDNETGLLVGFSIESTEVNGCDQGNTMTITLDSLPAGESTSARWIMASSLLGTFTDLAVSVSHSDELGGELTALLDDEDVRMHELEHAVLVDSSGQDAVVDFLVPDGFVYTSEGTKLTVEYPAAELSEPGANGQYTVSVPASTGAFIHAHCPFAEDTDATTLAARRSDGKLIRAENVWISRSREGAGEWQWQLNIFDESIPGSSYEVTVAEEVETNNSPSLYPIGSKSVITNQLLEFDVLAVDPDGDITVIEPGGLPAGAVFGDQEDGRGRFAWCPTEGQVGTYSIRFQAHDGELSDYERIYVDVYEESIDGGSGAMFFFR